MRVLKFGYRGHWNIQFVNGLISRLNNTTGNVQVMEQN